MARLTREIVVEAAMRLLDEAGLEGVSTRRLAQQLGVEQPALYWHFRNKAALLGAMAERVMSPHAMTSFPEGNEDWRSWFVDNFRSFRRALLGHRDGARLHAGSHPGPVIMVHIQRKIDFLVAAGIPENDSGMAMLAAGRYTIGCVLEEQAEAAASPEGVTPARLKAHTSAFESGLALFVDGLAQRKAVAGRH